MEGAAHLFGTDLCFRRTVHLGVRWDNPELALPRTLSDKDLCA